MGHGFGRQAMWNRQPAADRRLALTPEFLHAIEAHLFASQVDGFLLLLMDVPVLY